jgi:hypothetical protein
MYLALLMAMGLAGIARRLTSVPLRRTALVAVGIVLLVELRPSLGELQTVWREGPGIRLLVPDPDAVIANMPFAGPGALFWHDSVYMYWSTFHWRRLINGMSGFIPPHYGPLSQIARRFPADEALDAFAALGTQYFVLHQGYYREEYIPIVEAARAQARLQFVGLSRWEGGEARVYRLLR